MWGEGGGCDRKQHRNPEMRDGATAGGGGGRWSTRFIVTREYSTATIGSYLRICSYSQSHEILTYYSILYVCWGEEVESWIKFLNCTDTKAFVCFSYKLTYGTTEVINSNFLPVSRPYFFCCAGILNYLWGLE